MGHHIPFTLGQHNKSTATGAPKKGVLEEKDVKG